MAPLPLPSFISPLVLPTPPEKYTAQDQREFRRAIERAFLTINTAGFSGTSMWFNVTSSAYQASTLGSIDAVNSFQAAISDASVNGGIVYAPPGRYLFGSEVTVPANVIIRGDGPATVFVASGMGGKTLFKATSMDTVAFESFTIEGVLGEGASAISCTNVIFRNLTISGATEAVVALGSCSGISVSLCEDVIIEENYLFGNGTPSETTAGWDIKCNGYDFHGTKRHFIRNNRCLSTTCYVNIGGFNLQESEISGNECAGAKARTIALNGGYGILLYTTGFFTPWSALTTFALNDVVYSGFELYVSLQAGNLNHDPPSSPTWWELVDHSVRDNRVVNNHVHDVGSSGIYTASARRTIISENLIENFGAELDETSNPVAGISINGGAATVTSNRIRDSIRSGITFSGVNEPGGIIADNAIDRCTGNAGIRLGGLTQGVNINTNVINDCTNGITSADATWLVFGCSIAFNIINRSASRGILIIYPVSTIVDSNTIRESGATGLELDVAAAGRNNSASFNLVTDSNQTAGGYHNIVVLSPYSTYNNNRVGNTLALGAEKGLVVDAGAAVGSVALGNIAFDNRTADFDFPDTLVRGGNRDTANVLGMFTLGSTAVLEGGGGAICQLLFGSAPVTHSVGKQFSTSDFVVASNASEVAGDLWHQNIAGSVSTLERRRLTGVVERYVAAAGTADGTFAAFWGTPIETLDPTGLTTSNSPTLHKTSVALTNGAAAALGTLTNAPVAGPPTKWLKVDDNGTTRWVPSW